MENYEKVLGEIDEGLIDEFHLNPNWNSDDFGERKESFLNCLRKYMEEHPDKKEKVKDILADDEHYCLSNNRAGHVRLYFLPLFHDTETLLHILENPNSYQEENILSYDIEKEVLDVILEREPEMLATYLRRHPERKEEYKAQVSDFFVKVQKGEITYSRYDKRFDFFDIYKEDSKLWMGLLENSECSSDLCYQIFKVSKDEQVISKALDLLFIHSDDKNVALFAGLLEIKPTVDIAEKVFNCCVQIPGFMQEGSLYGFERSAILKIADIGKDSELFNRVLDSAIENGCTGLFAGLLEIRPTADVLQKITAYYKKQYQDEAKSKVKMCWIEPYLREICPQDEDEVMDIYLPEDNEEAVQVLKKLIEKDDDMHIQFADMDSFYAYVYCTEKIKFDIWRSYPTPEIDEIMQAYLKENYGHMDGFEATPEFYERNLSVVLEHIRDSEMKEKLQRDEDVRIKVLTKQKKFNYFAYYQEMCEMWRVAAQNTEDLSLLDAIAIQNERMKRRTSQQMQLEEVYREKGYIRKKLKKLFPRLSFEKAVALMVKKMETTQNKKEKVAIQAIMMAEGFDFYIDFIKNSEGKIDKYVLDFMLKEKERMIERLPNEIDREGTYDKIQNLEMCFRENEIIKTVLKEKYPDLEFYEALIKEAARVVKSGDEEQKEQFNRLILAEGEKRLLNEIDRDVCDRLFNHFTEQELEDVNALRSFYGLKIIVDETPFADANLRAVRRMQFEDVVREPEPWSEYYVVQHSEEYRHFRADKRRKFKESDYYDVMDESEAIKVLREHGYADFVMFLPEALAQAKVPPEIAVKFNVKDLQAIFFEQLPDEEKDVYTWDGRFLFTKNRIELEGQYDTKCLFGARETYWMDMVGNKQLVEAMKDDLRRHNISEDDIKRLFECAENEGFPNAGRKWEKVTSVSFQLHHVLGLKDGGLNYPSNYAPVFRYDDGLNSHTPLHWHDTPLDVLYKVEGVKSKTDVMLSTKPLHKGAKEVRMRTVFVDDENNRGGRVLFYGGARKCSRYVGRLHGMENIALRAQRLGMEQMQKDEEMKALVQIVFQHARQTIEQANSHIDRYENKKKRQRIEKKREEIRLQKKKAQKERVSQKDDF